MRSKIAKKYWEEKILSWEKLRYSPFLILYPISWTLRRRLYCSKKLLNNIIKSSDRIIELGCGSGILISKISAKFQNYIGYDIAGNAILQAGEQNKLSNVSFIEADIVNMNSFDCEVLVFLGLTDWLEYKDIENIFKKTSASNIIFSFTLKSENPAFGFYSLYRRLVDKKIIENRYHANAYSYLEIENLINMFGYQIKYFEKANILDPGVVVWIQK